MAVPLQTEDRTALLIAWRKAASRSAIIAAVFCVVVGVLLLGDMGKMWNANPRTSPQLNQLKAQLAQQPKSEQIKQDIRVLDEQLRMEYLRRLEFSRVARNVLIAGLALFLLAAGAAVSIKAREPDLNADGLQESSEAGSTRVGRLSVTVAGLAVLALMCVLVVSSPRDFSRGMRSAIDQAPPQLNPESASTTASEAAAPSQPSPPPATANGAAAPNQPMNPAPPPIGNLKPLPPLNPFAAGQIKPISTPGPGKAVSTGPPGSSSGGPPGSGGSVVMPQPAPKPERPKIEVIPFDASDYSPSDQDWLANWPAFRGPDGSAKAVGHYPTSWDVKTGKGIKWSVEVPLPGENSAVVWGDRVFVSGADKSAREIDCYDANNGKLLWRHKFENLILGAKVPDVMADTGYAPSTMVTDGKRVFAVFPNGDIVCCDYDGRRVWSRNLGTPDSMYGYASSLAMYKSLVIVQYDQGSSAEDGKSAIFALQGGTGQVVWYTTRPVPASWSSPVIARQDGNAVVIACAKPWVIGYDAMTGATLWQASCLGGDVAPAAVVGDGVVYACNVDSVLAAIRLGGTGDVTKSNILWKATDGLPSIPSPAYRESQVFLVSTEGTLTCYDAKSGKKLYENSLGEQFQSSPVVVGDLIYVSDEKGVTRVISTGTPGKEVSRGFVGERIGATPAFVNGRIYIRGEKHLFCIGGE